MKSVMGVAFCHTSSSNRPSTRIEPLGTRVAVACLRSEDCDCANSGDAISRNTTTPARRMELNAFDPAAADGQRGFEGSGIRWIFDADQDVAVRDFGIVQLSTAA